MSKYISFTKEQRERARRTDLAYFLIGQGKKVRKSGSEYEWLDGSQKVRSKISEKRSAALRLPLP